MPEMGIQRASSTLALSLANLSMTLMPCTSACKRQAKMRMVPPVDSVQLPYKYPVVVNLALAIVISIINYKIQPLISTWIPKFCGSW